MITIPKKLDMSPHGIPQVINVSQYDSDFSIQFKLYASVGTLTIESGTTAEIRGTKGSGMGYNASATIDVSNNTVTVAGDAQMTAVAGRNTFEIVLKKSGKVLGSANFVLLVERAALDADTITDATVLRDLEAIVEGAETATQAAEEAEDAADRAEAAAQTLVIDDTLTQAGQAADAKVTGDIRKRVNSLDNFIHVHMGWVHGGIINASGYLNTNNARCCSVPFVLEKGAKYKCGDNFEFVLYEYDLSLSQPVYIGVKTPVYITEYIAEDNATVMMVQKKPDGSVISDFDGVELFVSSLNHYTENKLIEYETIKDITGTIYNNTVIVGESGRITGNVNYATTDYIPVDEGEIVFVDGVFGGYVTLDNYTGVYGYDENKVLVGCILNLETAYGWKNFYGHNSETKYTIVNKHKIVIDARVKYIRVSSKVSDNIGKEPKVFSANAKATDTEKAVISWESGSISATGNNASANNRIRTDYLELSDSVIEIKANAQKIAYVLYDHAYNFLLNSGWKYCDFTIKSVGSAKFVRFVVSNADDSDITINDLTASIIESDTAQNLVDGFTETPFTNTVKVIMHRGYNSIAPENTIPAFKLAKSMGFSTIETDIQLTSDGEAVVLHDGTVDRTSNGTGNIFAMTLEQAKELDFGSWKSSMWEGTEIPTFEEMLICCKKIGLDVYIEIKQESPWTQEIMSTCVRKVRECGMKDHVTWISFSSTLLAYVKNADDTARLGYLMTTYTTGAVNTCMSLRTNKNEVIAVTRHDLLANEVLEYMIEQNVPLCGYLFDKCSDGDNMQSYVTEALTNEFNVAKYIYYKEIF